MNVFAFDPYRRIDALHWRNRLSYWRSHVGETLFHAAALLLLSLLAILVLQQQGGGWVDSAQRLVSTHPLPLAITLMALVGFDQLRARRAQRQRWSRDWLAAQPVAAAVRRRRQWGLLLIRLSVSLLVLVPLLAGADARPLWTWAVALAGASVCGHALGALRRWPRAIALKRERIVKMRSVQSIRDWQLIEAGAMLTPKRLAPLILVVLLVPRGPAQLVLMALLLLLVAAAIGGWQRAVGVLFQAQRWLPAQPVNPSRWVRASLWLPLQALLLFALAGAAIGALGSGVALAVLLATVPVLFGSLYLGVAAANRATPRRVSLEMSLHSALLIGLAQALPPLVPLAWPLQVAWLLRRGLRR